MGSQNTSNKNTENGNKRWIFGLAGGFVVVTGVLASYFYVSYGELDARLLQASAELNAARQEAELLREENDQLLEQAGLITLTGADGQDREVEQIPFAADPDDWKYILVNELHPLPQDFEVTLKKTQNGQRVDERIKEPLEEMIADAKKEGLSLLVCSSYRDYKKQDQLMDESITRFVRRGMDYKDAFFKTKEQIALTGASEHHTGLAVDIVGTGHQSLDESQADTKEAKWLAEHAADYGFVLRYPKDKEEITMISFESWHYRYVGKEAAAYMKKNNLCLEEFVELAQLQQERELLQAEEME
ncbi:MAG: M15 family metallopeptidase [Eubacteriales bacterium]|nr:M15 family metallopeptidase [Eubacteriales bacterium]